MSTVYKIEVDLVSPFCRYSEDEVSEIIKKLLNEYTNNSGLSFENINVETEIIA